MTDYLSENPTKNIDGEREKIEEILPWLKPGLTDEERMDAFEAHFKRMREVETQMKAEEMNLVKNIADQLRGIKTETEFLKLVDELSQNHAPITETVAIYRGNGSFAMYFKENGEITNNEQEAKNTYSIRIVVKPRRSYENRNDSIIYNVFAIKEKFSY